MSTKIKLQTKRFPKSRYIDNYKRLKFLPNFILIFMLLLIGLSIYWYYSLPQKVVDVQSPAELFEDSDTSKPSSKQNLTLTEVSTNNQQLSISRGADTCLIEFELDSLENGWVDSPFWWKPQEGCGIRMSGVQVAELSPNTWQSLSQQYGSDRVKLINDDWIALVIAEDPGIIFGFDLIRLLEPVSNNGFSIAAASDTKEISSSIFYLSDGCINQVSTACELWSLPVLGGDLSKIDDNILANGQNLLLKPSDQLRFARTQDLDSGVNLIIVSPDSSSITLLRYNISSREIIDVLELESTSRLFSDYIR